tara:strand:- start:2269 stop:3237 length:969 start_codon:yes stop_codon:yes gene_type:complete
MEHRDITKDFIDLDTENTLQAIQVDPDVVVLRTQRSRTITGEEAIKSAAEDGYDPGLKAGDTFSVNQTSYVVYLRGRPVDPSDKGYEESEWLSFPVRLYDGSGWEAYGKGRYQLDEKDWRYHADDLFTHNEWAKKEWDMSSKGTLTLEDIQAPKKTVREYILPSKLRKMVDAAFPEVRGMKCNHRYRILKVEGPDLLSDELDTLLDLCYTAPVVGDDPGPEIVLEDESIKAFIGCRVGHDSMGFGTLEYFPELEGKKQFLIKWEWTCSQCSGELSHHTGTGCHHGSFENVYDPETGEYIADLRNQMRVCACRSSDKNATGGA